MTLSSEALSQRCTALLDGAGEALSWIAETRLNSPRLDREAEGLIERLRQARNSARRLGKAATRPATAGFFGLSQAGKSYLISALAQGKNGSLETDMDDKRLNFIAHINPPGGGKEATGLVTRFTRRAVSTPKGFPVMLTLLSETDVVKILGNSFFNDFDQQRVSFRFEQADVRRHLEELERKAQPRETGGVTADDVVDLTDYFTHRFLKSMEAYRADFWPTATALAPFLLPEDRARLFSPLWGGIEELTAAYLRLQQGLAQVGHASTLYAELGALVRDVEGELSQVDSIMNVDMLARLGRDDKDLVQVVPEADGKRAAAVSLPRSLLAALAREMTFVLASPPAAEILENVDLLDFPGYRGRLDVADVKEMARRLEGRDPVAELILRGKVAYLFERYTDDLETNILVLCTPCHKQSDVEDLGKALEAWINAVQGATPEDRARRKPSLIWAVTMFDNRLMPRPDETKDLIRSGWSGMMRLTLLEKFEKSGWVNAWEPGKAFDNVFLVRKPGMAAGVVALDGKRETGVVEEQRERLEFLRQTFLEDASVRKHVRSPDEAWDAMLEPNDGGMGRLAAYLGEISSPEVKRARIEELATQIAEDLSGNWLGIHYQSEGLDAVKQKKERAETAVAALMKTPQTFGELLHALQPSMENLRALYLRSEAAAAESQTDASAPAAAPPAASFVSLDLSDFGAPPSTATQRKTPHASARTSLFARNVMSDWIKQTRALPHNLDMQSFLDMPEQALQIVVDEILTAADRLRIEEALSLALQPGEDESSTARTRLAGRQAATAYTVLSDFVDHLGFSALPPERRPSSSRIPGRRLFQAPPPFEGLPTLTAAPLNYSALAILDWFDAFSQAAVQNSGHAAGRDITPEQNERLGAVLALLAGSSNSGQPVSVQG